MASRSPLEIVQEFVQDALSLTPVVILGSGASAAHGIPGMGPLATHLVGLPIGTAWNATERFEWGAFCDALKAGTDLETALGNVKLTPGQTEYVVAGTRDLLFPFDADVFRNLLADRACLPLTRLLKHLFTSTHRYIDIVTPNYDRLAEYAADAGQFGFHTGFTQGYLQVRARPIDRKARDPSRTVCIWKVHGSLDWFRAPNGQIIGSGALHDTPSGHFPLMVTPGLDKYRLTHQEPFRTVFGYSDAALESARSYLCIGYGFNDEHVQTKMIERCETNNVPLVIITKSLSNQSKNLLSNGRIRRYAAIEESSIGIRIYSSNYPMGMDLISEPIWQLTAFLDFAIGGFK